MKRRYIGFMTMNEEERVADRVFINCGLRLSKIRTESGVWFFVQAADGEIVLKTPKFKRVKVLVFAIATNDRPMGVRAAMRRIRRLNAEATCRGKPQPVLI